MRFNSLLCLAIQFTGRRMHTQKKVNTQRMERTRTNKWECCERERGVCESYLGVKCPSMRPLPLINVIAQMESWDLQGSEHQGKSVRGRVIVFSATLGDM